MRNRLFIKALVSTMALEMAMALLLFLAAGTIRYWQAWVFLVIYMIGSVLITLYLVEHDPALLKRRLSGGPTREKRAKQKIIMLFISIGFIALLVVPGFDRRFGWSLSSVSLVIAGNVLVAVGLFLVFVVYKENTFSSATIEVLENQKVIATGPYALVRHPMYASGLLFLIGIPLALGSYWGLLVLLLLAPFLSWRLLDEEHFLAENLAGYQDYQKRVRFRLVPGVW